MECFVHLLWMVGLLTGHEAFEIFGVIFGALAGVGILVLI